MNERKKDRKNLESLILENKTLHDTYLSIFSLFSSLIFGFFFVIFLVAMSLPILKKYGYFPPSFNFTETSEKQADSTHQKNQ